ncbi:fatty acid desaturase family protein [Corallococcus sicarius]|uniref:Acyl-CoA desaturase n=1 Tax=Corallococcus sicarius TaxID=2316726 RepID=A0A3A8N0B6_9BACT|nr:acyl-CoA desaturase [Corallococcus sicarius]RKH34465.1 acyl-CoA desaturase [Corallococcus sicarius]
MTAPIRVTFGQRDASFAEDLKRRVSEYFETRNLSQRATGAMYVKALAILGFTFGTYGLLLTGWFGPWAMLGMAVMMGAGIAGIGFCVGHDGVHGSYSDNPRVNTAVGLAFDLIGANSYMWRITHNVLHHTYTNIQGMDEDLTVSPQLRLSPHSEWKPYHRAQHLYAFLAYSLTTVFWVFAKDYKYFFQKDLGPYKDKKHAPAEWARLIGMKAVYYAWTLVIPWMVLDVAWWQFALGLLAMHMTAGFILGIVFQLAHVVEATDYPVPDQNGNVEDAWMVHQLRTTANFARKNRVLSWYVGGLNYQIEHHLFPKVCSIHYPALSEIVQATAKEHGLPYPESETFLGAVGSHYRMLKQLGRRPASVTAEQPKLAVAA